jgi:riboflavin biosynthesis pyrimidine reductase
MDKLPVTVSEIFPQKRSLPLEGLYLKQDLLRISERLRRAFVYTNYVSDVDDIIAIKDENGDFQIPKAIKNPFDWLFFQELEAQADVIITSTSYLRRFSASSKATQNILSEFEPGSTFENFGNWRLLHGFKTRSPHIAIVARSLDFKIPDVQKLGNRKAVVFTTDSIAGSWQARTMKGDGIPVVGCGMKGVKGKVMIEYLAAKMGYRTIEMTTGPAVLKILLDADVLDRIYVSQVQRKIPVTDPSSIKRILSGGAKLSDRKDFILSNKYVLEKASLEDATIAAQEFLLYDNKRFLLELQRQA